MEENYVDLNGTNYVSNIPAVYYNTIASVVEKFADKGTGQLLAKVTLPGGAVISTTINLIKDPENPGKVIASTTMATGVTYAVTSAYGASAVAATEVLIGGILATFGIAASPVVVTLSAIGVVAVGTIYAGNKLQEFIYDTLNTAEKELEIFSNDIYAKVKDNFRLVECYSDQYPESKFMDNKATMTSNIYRCSNKATGFEFSFDKSAHTATIQTGNQTTKEQAIEKVFEMKEIQTLTIDNQTYNIKNLSNLQILNALDSIPEVSFLLSTINLPITEIDLGEKGTYQVKQGDTLSQIAQDNNMTTKELVKLNTWLLDENRVKFLQDKILVDTTLSESELNNKNHTLIGDSNAENILIDANGGDNEFIGGSKADKMQSKGKGYDIYHANNGDIIQDYDHQGKVYFNSTLLKYATYNKTKSCYVNGDLEYHLNGSVLSVKSGSEILTINNYSKENKSLGIVLLDENEVAFEISGGTVKEGNGTNQAQFSVSLIGSLKEN